MASQKLEFPKNNKIKADSKVKKFINKYEEKMNNPKKLLSYLKAKDNTKDTKKTTKKT